MGKTIVFVSHDLSSISKYCDRVFLLNKGELLGEGGSKEMIDAYKRVLVGQYEVADSSDNAEFIDSLNPNALEYGTKQAEILEYYITDDTGIRTSAVIKGSEYTLHMKVRINEDIPAPIFAFSVKNAHGTEITGTNTMLEKAFLDSCRQGDIKEITFRQKMTLQGGEYLISMGVTGYEGDKFEVYHRLYDALNITVVSDKDTVGYFDCSSVVTVNDAHED
jgi:teichoic acid transport system ATP-binding protein